MFHITKKHLLLILITISLVTHFACQKSLDPVIPIVPVITDSNYLDKIYYIYDNGSGVDTQDVTTFHYDNLKRVTSLNDSFVTSTGFEYYSSTNYSYFGTDTLPHKSVVVYKQGSSQFDTLTTYHFYDSQQRKQTDSVLITSYNTITLSYSLSKKITGYSYGPNKLYGKTNTTYLIPTGLIFDYTDTADLNNKGDIITNRKYVKNGLNYELNTTSNFTYDTRLNPFSNLNIFLTRRQFPNGETLETEYIGHNNIVSQNEITISPAYNFSLNYSYTYNLAGYPLIATYLGSSTTDEIHYKYKSL